MQVRSIHNSSKIRGMQVRSIHKIRSWGSYGGVGRLAAAAAAALYGRGRRGRLHPAPPHHACAGDRALWVLMIRVPVDVCEHTMP